MTPRYDSRALRKFAKFLKDNAIPKRRAARDLHVSAPSILDWLEGNKSPERANRVAIRVYTKGLVLEDDWETKEERRALERAGKVDPYEPEPKDPVEAPVSTPGAAE